MTDGEPETNFAYHVLTTLEKRPEKTILIVEGEAVTGREFHERVTTTAHLLRWKGAAPNDRVLVTMAPSVDFYAIAIAALTLGCSIIIIDPSMGIERANHCIALAKPSIWVWKKGSKFKYLRYLLPALRSIPIHLEVADLVLPTTISDLLAPSDCIPVDHALVTFTTGSTGMPKLLLRQHSFLMNQTQSLSMSYEMVIRSECGLEEPESVWATNLPVLPLHFLKVGCLGILYPKILQSNPATVISTLKKHDCTALSGSPAFIERLASYALKQNTTLPVRFTGVGGAPVFRGCLRTVSSTTPDKKTVVLYGSTEAEPISMIFAKEKMEAEASLPDGLCVGKPVFKGSVKVIQILSDPLSDPINVSEELELSCGEIGELIVSGWHVNTYQVEPKRLISDVNGTVWLRIEDAGYMDSEGRIWLVGRVKWRVERNGRTYWSTVVEQKILDRCSLITFAAYLPHPHNKEAWLFLEAPKGLPDHEKAGIESFLTREGIPVDRLEIQRHVARDRRHQSKPNTALLFGASNPNSPGKIFKFFLKSNPSVAVGLVLLQLLLIVFVVALIFSQ